MVHYVLNGQGWGLGRRRSARFPGQLPDERRTPGTLPLLSCSFPSAFCSVPLPGA